VVSARGKLLAAMNAAFFVCVLIVVLVSESVLQPLPSEGFRPSFPEIIDADLPLMFLVIFLYNLAVSAIVVVSVPGFLFFPLSTGFLLYRAAIWGLLLHYQPNWVLLLALPTLVFEGEGYVFAAAGGSVVGISWLRPKWIFTNDMNSSRVAALRKALKEYLAILFFVTVFLLVAAAIETLTLKMLVT
jgi:hypothetical protein